MVKGHNIWYLELQDSLQDRRNQVSSGGIRYKLDLVGVQEVRWEGKGREGKGREGKGRDIKQQTTIHFSMEKGMLITN
jgi:hypothetical protein